MKIATYNIWNHQTTLETRLDALCDEITKINADMIALQEVPLRLNGCSDDLLIKHVMQKTGYEHYLFKAYPDDDEGLGFLSRTPIEEVECPNNTKTTIANCGLRAISVINGMAVGVTNVHLDWKSVLTREQEIVAVTEWIDQDSSRTQIEFLCGDFNSFPHISSIYHFLTGQQSLAGKDTSWIDLPELFANAKGCEPAATLDFKQNKWLQNRDRLNDFRKPYRFDWILLKSLYPQAEPYLVNAGLFGVGQGTSQPPPSDHYGVFVELRLPRLKSQALHLSV